MPSMMDAMLTDTYEDNMTGEPDAVKAARPVRKGIERKGLATIPRSQSTLHPYQDAIALVVAGRIDLKSIIIGYYTLE